MRGGLGPELQVLAVLAGLQCLLLAGGIGWIATRSPAVRWEDTGRERVSSVDLLEARPRRRGEAPGRCGPDRRSTADLEVPVHPTAEAALQDYLSRLHQSFDAEPLLDGTLSLSRLRAAASAAERCTGFRCPALLEYRLLLASLGRSVPPYPSWEGESERERERRLVTDYIHGVTTRLRETAEGEARADLVLDVATVQAALGCQSFNCPAMNEFIEAAGVAFTSIGKPAPQLPELHPTTAKRSPPPPSRPMEAPGAGAPPPTPSVARPGG